MEPSIDRGNMSRITSEGEAYEFLNECVARYGLAFHPDTSFMDYGDFEKPEDALLLDLRMDETFEILGAKVYEYSLTLEPFRSLH